MTVKKFGRTTGFTKGIIQAFSRRPNPYPFDLPKFKATVWFKNVWTVAPLDGAFALPGDSGSLVVSEDGLTAVGILFAADKQVRVRYYPDGPCNYTFRRTRTGRGPWSLT